MFVPSTEAVPSTNGQQPDDGPADRRLARAGLADEADDLALPDVEAHAVDGTERRRPTPLRVLDRHVAQVDD